MRASIVILLVLCSFGMKAQTSLPDSLVQWSYHTTINEESNSKVSYALVNSTHQYKRENSVIKDPVIAQIMVGEFHGNKAVMFMTNAVLENGLSGSMAIQFDDNLPKLYKYSYVPNEADKAIIFEDSKGLLKEMQTSDRLLVKAAYLSQGDFVFPFDISNLDPTKIE